MVCMIRAAWTLGVMALAVSALGVCAGSGVAQVVWVTPHPASETIPAGAHLLRISVGSSLKPNQPKQRPLTVTSAQKIDRIAALIDALPAAQPGLRACPVDFGITVRLAFYRKRGASPLAIAKADPGGCGPVALTIEGRAQPALEGGAQLLERVRRVLGVKLDTSPPLR